MEKQIKHPKTPWETFAEQMFNEIFDDYANTSEWWQDFEEYQKQGYGRMKKIIGRHTRKIVTLVLQTHYNR